MTGERDLVIRDSEKVRLVTIDRPKASNSLRLATLRQLRDILEAIPAELDLPGGCRALVITGAGDRAFCAGADIKELQVIGTDRAAEQARLGQEVFSELESTPVVTIAAINGYALGGGLELALACDFRIASADAELGQPEVGLGTIPGWGGTLRLPRLIGLPAAKDLIFSSDRISAARAADLGLVDTVVEAPRLLPAAQELAARYTRRSPWAIARAKAAIHTGLTHPDDGLQAEERFVAEAAAKGDRQGIEAFGREGKPVSPLSSGAARSAPSITASALEQRGRRPN